MTLLFVVYNEAVFVNKLAFVIFTGDKLQLDDANYFMMIFTQA